MTNEIPRAGEVYEIRKGSIKWAGMTNWIRLIFPIWCGAAEGTRR